MGSCCEKSSACFKVTTEGESLIQLNSILRCRAVNLQIAIPAVTGRLAALWQE